jgi:hypothetical protein
LPCAAGGRHRIGAAGTLVARQRIGQAALRRALARCLPFDAEIVICSAGHVLNLLGSGIFAGQPMRPEIVRFVTVLSRPPAVLPLLPMEFRHGRVTVTVRALLPTVSARYTTVYTVLGSGDVIIDDRMEPVGRDSVPGMFRF